MLVLSRLTIKLKEFRHKLKASRNKLFHRSTEVKAQNTPCVLTLVPPERTEHQNKLTLTAVKLNFGIKLDLFNSFVFSPSKFLVHTNPRGLHIAKIQITLNLQYLVDNFIFSSVYKRLQTISFVREQSIAQIPEPHMNRRAGLGQDDVGDQAMDPVVRALLQIDRNGLGAESPSTLIPFMSGRVSTWAERVENIIRAGGFPDLDDPVAVNAFLPAVLAKITPDLARDAPTHSLTALLEYLKAVDKIRCDLSQCFIEGRKLEKPLVRLF